MKHKTTELYLAAWLFGHKGIDLINHYREDNRRSVFEFQGPDIADLVQQYNVNEAFVNIATLASSLRQLKSIMYGGVFTKPIQHNDKIQTKYL